MTYFGSSQTKVSERVSEPTKICTVLMSQWKAVIKVNQYGWWIFVYILKQMIFASFTSNNCVRIGGQSGSA